MSRITVDELRSLFPQEASTVAVDSYIEDANLLVTELLGTSTLSEARLRIIEKYLAAHFFVLGQQEGGIFEESIGETKEKRGSTFTLGQGLRLTRWGQMVLSFDSTGSFAQHEGAVKKNALFRLV